MSNTTREPDLLIVGGGILGTVGALLAAKIGWTVELWRLPDEDRPEADTLRNLAWLHSGLVHAHKRDVEFAGLLRREGRAMAARFGIKLDRAEDGGIFYVPASVARSFDAIASALKLSPRPLTPGERRKYLPPFRSTVDKLGEEHRCFWVPDRPFPETEILHKCREAALATGRVYIYERPGPVTFRLQANGTDYEIKTPEGVRTPKRTLIAAGVRLPSILDDLKIPHDLKVFRTPLLCQRGEAWIPQTRLFYAFHTGLGILRYPSPSGYQGSCEVVINATVCNPVNCRTVHIRRVTSQEIDDTIGVLPRTYQSLMRVEPRPYTVTAAYKVGKERADSPRPDESPWIKGPSELNRPNLYAAIPGRATLAWYTAEKALKLMLGIPPHANLPRPVRSTGRSASEWDRMLRMHYDYPNLDEI